MRVRIQIHVFQTAGLLISHFYQEMPKNAFILYIYIYYFLKHYLASYIIYVSTNCLCIICLLIIYSTGKISIFSVQEDEHIFHIYIFPPG